jgi:hypothetical protein
VNDTRVTDALHLLIDFKTRLEDLTQDIDRSYRPTILFLTQRNLPGTDDLCAKLQTATTAIEELHEIVSGVSYAGDDEGAFLYWEFEVREVRNQEEAEAAMREAFAGQELADCLVLYREYKAKLPTLPESDKPTLKLHRPSDAPTEES